MECIAMHLRRPVGSNQEDDLDPRVHRWDLEILPKP